MRDFEFIYGWRVVGEALQSRSRMMQELWIQEGKKDPRISSSVSLARQAGIQVRWVSPGELEKVAPQARHQGIAAKVALRRAELLEHWIKDPSRGPSDVIVVLDQVQDPHNLGAIARSASCLGAKGLVLPKRNAAGVTPAAVQASAGALEKIPVFTVVNLSQALDQLKKNGFWVYGADMSGKKLSEVSFSFPLVLVLGSEGEGIRPLVRERCDELVAIPQEASGVASLNVSCAASILLYEIQKTKT